MATAWSRASRKPRFDWSTACYVTSVKRWWSDWSKRTRMSVPTIHTLRSSLFFTLSLSFYFSFSHHEESRVVNFRQILIRFRLPLFPYKLCCTIVNNIGSVYNLGRASPWKLYYIRATIIPITRCMNILQEVRIFAVYPGITFKVETLRDEVDTREGVVSYVG